MSFRPKLTKIENASVVITPYQIALFQKVKHIHINPSIIGPFLSLKVTWTQIEIITWINREMRQMTYVNFSAGELVESKPKLVHLCTELYIRNRSNNAFQPFWLTWHHFVYSVYILSRSKPDALVINHDASWDTSGNRIWNVQFLKIQNFWGWGYSIINQSQKVLSANGVDFNPIFAPH